MLPPFATVIPLPATMLPANTPEAPVQLTTFVSITCAKAFLLVNVTETGDVALVSLTFTAIVFAQVYCPLSSDTCLTDALATFPVTTSEKFIPPGALVAMTSTLTCPLAGRPWAASRKTPSVLLVASAVPPVVLQLPDMTFPR